MNRAKKTPLAWATVGLLAAIVATNVAFLVLLRTSGPLIGIAFYAVLLVVVCSGQQHGNRAVTMGSLVGLVVHVAEATILGWTPYPALMVLNIVLPAVLACVAWLAGRQLSQENSGK
jgi:hypothetical protein